LGAASDADPRFISNRSHDASGGSVTGGGSKRSDVMLKDFGTSIEEVVKKA